VLDDGRPLAESARSSGTSAEARVSCRKTLTSARRSCNGCSSSSTTTSRRSQLHVSGSRTPGAGRVHGSAAGAHSRRAQGAGAMGVTSTAESFSSGDGLTLADIALYPYSACATRAASTWSDTPRCARGSSEWLPSLDTSHRRVVQIRQPSRRIRCSAGVQELDLAEPKTGEVLVRLVACGVCHTDLYTASARSLGLLADRARARRRGCRRARGATA